MPHLPLRASSASKPGRLARRTLAGTALFVAGYVSAIAGAPYATSVNVGLVNALDSVGKNLFGDAVFSAIPGNPIIPGNPVRVDIASDSQIATALGVFTPPDPNLTNDTCHRVAQMVVTPAATTDSLPSVALYYDSSKVTPIAIPGNPIAPNVARCPAVATN